MEVLTFALCATHEIFDGIRQKDDKKTAVTLANPRVQDFTIVRTCLLPGLLKTIGESMSYPKPIRIFEVSDVVFLDNTTETGAKQRRHMCAMYCDTQSGLEFVQPLLRRVMDMNGIPFAGKTGKKGYSLRESTNETYFKGRRADIYIDDKKVGTIGIVHPEVLAAFKVKYPCSAFEIDIEDLC
uniref:Phenylalanyl tRNA synthetase beta chain core domain-containing protein n=1 Tax=Lotharella oceanica TaxID=641309 RepID=A0A7S2TWG2_9EUKA